MSKATSPGASNSAYTRRPSVTGVGDALPDFGYVRVCSPTTGVCQRMLPVSALTQMIRRVCPFCVDAVRNTLSCQTIGEELPSPAMRVFHVIPCSWSHCIGAWISSLTPDPSPRQPGQTGPAIAPGIGRVKVATAMAHTPVKTTECERTWADETRCCQRWSVTHSWSFVVIRGGV